MTMTELTTEKKNLREGFITPPKHVNFEAKKLFGELGQITEGSIAYINLKGGGPVEQHTHEHNHLFIVVRGEAKVFLGDEEVIIHKDEAYLVKGMIPHSVWSNQDEETVMIGISVKESKDKKSWSDCSFVRGLA